MLFYWSWTTVAAVGFATFSSYLVVIVVYRLWFHPLSKVPGPFLQRISGLPRVWQCYVGNRHLREAAAHQKYGRVVRIGPNSICFNTLSGLQTLHVKSANVVKGDEFYGLLDGGPEGGKSVQMTQANEEHATRRRVLDHALPSRGRAFTSINRLSKQFAETAYSIALANEGKVNMTKVTTWYSFDVINTLSFGKSTNMLESDEYRWLPSCLQDTSIFLYAAGYASYVHFWRWFLGSSWPRRLAFRPALAAQRYVDFSSERVIERKARLAEEKTGISQPQDIFKGLIQSGLFHDLDLRADSSLLIAAGSDAVRVVIVTTLYYWLRNPGTLRKAVEEIRSHDSDYPDNITESTIGSLKYLRACIDESMRLTPPKPSSVPREIRAGGIVCDGIRVPEGMTAGISTYSLHHDPDIYPRPWEYSPERWLQRPMDLRMQNAFHPFLKGPRACPGKAVAYFAIQLALFHLVSQFDISAMDDVAFDAIGSLTAASVRKNEYPFNDWIIAFGDGPVTTLRPRSIDESINTVVSPIRHGIEVS